MEQDEIGIAIDTAFELNKPRKAVVDKSRFQTKAGLRTKYAELSNQLESKLNEILTKAHQDFLSEMINYVLEYRSNLQNGDQFKLSFVHTGVISISCSKSEHEFIFEQFIDELTKKQLQNVISVSASEKVTVDTIVQMIYERILTDDLLKQLRIDEKNEKKFQQSLRFSQFAKIYEQHGGNEPIILLLDDLIFLNYETVNHLFRLLHDNLRRVPVLVFAGLSQASISLQSIIQPETLSDLIIHSFATRNVCEVRDEVFENVLIGSELKLRFGGGCLGYFLNAFNNYDFSIKNIERLAKLAIWDFCYSNEDALLNGTAGEFERKLGKLDDQQIQRICVNTATSFGIKFEGDVRKQLVGLFKQMQTIESDFMNELKALHQLIAGLLEDKKFYRLYIDYLSDENGEELQKLAKLLRPLSRDAWKTRLETAIHSDSESRLLQEVLRPQFEKFGDIPEQEAVVAEQKKQQQPLADKVKNRASFQAAMRQNALNPSKNSPFDSWKNETVKLIEEHFKNLPNPSRSPLSELFYCDNVERLKELDLVSPRETITRRLASSEEFVRSIQSAQQKENNALVNFRPSICTAFKLYRESQVKINLADWLESYKAQIEQTEGAKTVGRKQKLSQADLMKSFFSNVHDLNYLGILEKAARTSDYVTKLVL